jgi:hypothetical protein
VSHSVYSQLTRLGLRFEKGAAETAHVCSNGSDPAAMVTVVMRGMMALWPAAAVPHLRSPFERPSQTETMKRAPRTRSEDAAPDMAPRATYYSDDGHLRFMATVNYANPPTPSSAGSRNTSPSRSLRDAEEAPAPFEPEVVKDEQEGGAVSTIDWSELPLPLLARLLGDTPDEGQGDPWCGVLVSRRGGVRWRT